MTRPSIIRAYALGIVTGSILAATTIAVSPSAKADVTDADIDEFSFAVCATLDDGFDTFNGIIGIGEGIAEYGYSLSDAGEIIYGAVRRECPRYLPLINRFAHAYAHTANHRIA